MWTFEVENVMDDRTLDAIAMFINVLIFIAVMVTAVFLSDFVANRRKEKAATEVRQRLEDYERTHPNVKYRDQNSIPPNPYFPQSYPYGNP